MPMDKSGSAQSVGKNYKTSISEGKSKKQSLAIALSEQRTHAKGKVKSKLEAAYAKHMAGTEEKGETKKESKKTEKGEM